MSRRALLVVAVVIAFGLVLLSALTGFFVDWLWFDTLGFGSVFATVWHAKLTVFGIATAAEAVSSSVTTALATAATGGRLSCGGAPKMKSRAVRSPICTFSRTIPHPKKSVAANASHAAA